MVIGWRWDLRHTRRDRDQFTTTAATAVGQGPLIPRHVLEYVAPSRHNGRVGKVGGPARLDTVVRRWDRASTAATPGLVTALFIALLWPPVLVVCWGILEAPWLSLVPGLLLTGGVIWWGVRVGRIGLAQSREAAPFLVVTADEVQVWNASVPGMARLPRDAIRAVAVDAPPRRQRRADRVRFAVGDSGWLYCPDEAALPTIGFGGFERTPNLAVLFQAAVPISAGGVTVRGFLAALTDPDAARAALGPWLRPLEPTDVHGLSLPVRRVRQEWCAGGASRGPGPGAGVRRVRDAGVVHDARRLAHPTGWKPASRTGGRGIRRLVRLRRRAQRHDRADARENAARAAGGPRRGWQRPPRLGPIARAVAPSAAQRPPRRQDSRPRGTEAQPGRRRRRRYTSLSPTASTGGCGP